MEKKIRSEDILRLFERKQLNQEETVYLKYHLERLVYMTNLVRSVIGQNQSKNILDVGPHFLTSCLLRLVKPQPNISTIGFANERLFPEQNAVRHIELDLNNCASIKPDGSDAEFDLITFSETIEHLHTSPTTILSYLSRFLKKESGAGILIQTPNAASFLKRIVLLAGINPYEKIRVDKANPGHFREYTMKELEQYGNEAGFKVSFREYCSYWSGNNPVKRTIDLIPSFREGITVLYVKNRT